jgi:hypothetical protein
VLKSILTLRHFLQIKHMTCSRVKCFNMPSLNKVITKCTKYLNMKNKCFLSLNACIYDFMGRDVPCMAQVPSMSVLLKGVNTSAHTILNSNKIYQHKRTQNSSLKTGDHPHKMFTTTYTTQPAIHKHQGTPVTPYISIVIKLM